MAAEIFDKATAKSRSVSLDSIDLDSPSVVRLQMSRSNVAGLERQGDDLIIRLQSGETIRIVDFYEVGPDGAASDLVLQEPDGSMWQARPGSGTQFYELKDWGELVPGAALASDAGGAGAGILLPALGLLGVGGLVAAAAGGGGSDDDGDPPTQPPTDVTPPAAPTADVDDATGTTVTGTGEAGAKVTVYAPNGTTVLGTGTVQPNGTYSVTIPAQTNGEALIVKQADAAGNVSGPTSATAPDLTAPAAPTADVDDATGTTVTGTGEAGAKVTVYGPDGTTVLGTGTVKPDGTYSVTVPAQTNGEVLIVKQADAAGNVSGPTTITAPDLTAPAAPTADVDDATGTTVTGTGEPGATVTVYAPDGTTVLGTGTVQPDGAYSVTIPAQTNGEALIVKQADAAGNVSGPTSATAPDLTAPAAPTADVDDATGTTVTGTGEAGATVTVYAPDGTTVLGTGTVQPDGTYSVTIPAQANGEELAVTQTDPAGNESGSTTITAPDLTAPAAPTADVDDATGATVTGTGEAGATVTVYAPDGTTVLGTGTVQLDGTYSVTIPAQTNGEALTVTQTDAAGNESAPTTTLAPDFSDVTAPNAPTADVDDATGTTVTGTGEVGATVTVYGPDGTTVLGTGTVQPDGTYSVTIPAQTNGEALTVTQTDPSGNESAPTAATAPDLTAPDAPTADVDDATGATVTGTGEAGATVTVYGPDGTTVLGTGTVQPDGSYSVTITPAQTSGGALTVTQADPSGNESAPTTTLAPDFSDVTAPNAPTADVDDATGATVTGTGEAGATVTVYAPDGATVLGTGTVQPDGSYSVTIPAQTNGEALTVTQTDPSGNESAPAAATAPDLTAPDAPTADVDDATGATVTGTGEAGATVTVYAPDGTTVLGTGTVQPDGTYSVTIPAQTNGEALTVTQTDPSGNESAPTTTLAPDFSDVTAPNAPTADVDDATGATVTGTGEAGATVTVYAPDGTTVLGTGTVQPDGTYSVVIPAQTNGEALTVTQTDPSGNESAPAAATAPDLTAPDAPTADVDDATGATVTGTGEAGATVTVYAPDGTTVLGTGTVQPNGSYSVAIAPAQTNGEDLIVKQADPTGNVSDPVTAEAPDFTDPAPPTADVDDVTGATVTGTGEPGATVTVYAPDGITVLGTGTVQPNGTYSVAIAPAQTNGEDLIVKQADATGNVSDPVTAEAPDFTDPAPPTADVDDVTGATVTGTGEPGATVTVYAPDGTTVLGTGTVQPGGGYSVIIPAQINGEDLIVTQTDAAGNESGPTPAEAPDFTDPAPPTADVDDATGTTVTGSGEPGATVTVYAPDGTTVLGTGTVQPGGSYSVTIPAQTNGEDLTVTQTDAVGNESAPTPAEAPDQFVAFGNVDSAGLDLVPVTTNVNVGSANYLALVSLVGLNPQLDLAGLQLLGITPVSFTVQPGHELDALFEYGGVLDVGVASDYRVVLQKFVDGQWVGVDGSGELTLLDLNLLNGDFSGSLNLEAGQYRAFVTFEGLLGLGVLGQLNVTGVDSDFTDIADIIAITAEGNVITDPNGSGETDLTPAGTVVHSVTVNGVTTDVLANGTVVAGQHGTLVINLDGSYVYTPDEDAANIGQTETFTYTLQNVVGAQESATLTINIGSPDVTAAAAATDDVAAAAVLYENTVTEVSTPLFTLTNGIIGTETDSAGFTVAADTESDVTVNIGVSSVIALFPSYTVTLTNTDTGTVVDTQNVTAIVDLLGLTSASVTFADLPPGNYSVEVSASGIGVGFTSTVVLDQDITNFTQFQVDTVAGADGNLLDNDVAGSSFSAILVDSGTGFQEIGNVAATLTGAYGTLTVDAAGNYHYEPDPNLAHFTTDQVDIFAYQIRHPNGQVVQAELTVTVDVVDPGGVLPFAASAISFEAGDSIPLDGFDSANRGSSPGLGEVDNFVYDLFEGQGDLVKVLESYLESSQADHDDKQVKTVAEGAGEPSLAPVEDPLSYLSNIQDDELNLNSNLLI